VHAPVCISNVATTSFAYRPVSCEPSNLTQSYDNAFRVSNTVRLWTGVILQDAEASFREGIPSFGSATRPTLGRANVALFSSPTVRRRWSRERHRKDGGAPPLLSLTRRPLAHRMSVGDRKPVRTGWMSLSCGRRSPNSSRCCRARCRVLVHVRSSSKIV